MSKSKLKKKLDAIFSKYIRWYYADANGYGVFEDTVPTGYYAICSKNIKEFG